jgi:hypothetical protein
VQLQQLTSVILIESAWTPLLELLDRGSLRRVHPLDTTIHDGCANAALSKPALPAQCGLTAVGH